MSNVSKQCNMITAIQLDQARPSQWPLVMIVIIIVIPRIT